MLKGSVSIAGNQPESPGFQLTLQEVCHHQQLKAQFWRDLHVGHVLRILVPLGIVEVLADLLEYHGAMNCRLVFGYMLLRCVDRTHFMFSNLIRL